MRIEGAPRYHISTLLQTPQHSWSWVATLRALGRFLIWQRYPFIPLISLLLRFRSSLVALQQFACRFFALLFAFSLPNLDGLRLDVNYKFFVPPCGFKLKRLLQLKFIGWKRVHCIFKLQSGILLSRLANQKQFYFFDSQVRVKCHMLVSSTY